MRNRHAVVMSNQKCELSGRSVMSGEFILFPCRHAFLTEPLAKKVLEYRQRPPAVGENVVILERSLLTKDWKAPSHLVGQSATVDERKIKAGADPEEKQDDNPFLEQTSVHNNFGQPVWYTVVLKNGKMVDVPLGSIQVENRRPIDTSKITNDTLMELATRECPLCGDVMIDEVQRPFVDLDLEQDEIDSWKIGDEDD